MVITGLYTALTVLILVVLSTRIGLIRAKTGTSINDGGDQELALRIRQHGNLTENAAITLLAIAIVEYNGAPDWAVHALGAVFVISRILHPIGLKADNAMHPLRGLGAAASQLVLLIAAGYAAWQFATAG
ncbi:MAG: MAPEG family protein [Pseudomonadota bacterium]